jgi:hypothetical protein
MMAVVQFGHLNGDGGGGRPPRELQEVSAAAAAGVVQPGCGAANAVDRTMASAVSTMLATLAHAPDGGSRHRVDAAMTAPRFPETIGKRCVSQGRES